MVQINIFATVYWCVKLNNNANSILNIEQIYVTDKTIVMSFEDLLHRHKQETRNKRSVELSNRPRLSNVNGNNETEDSEHWNEQQ